jgi:hypothetical protein
MREINGVLVDTPIPLLELHLVAVRIAEMIQPCPVVKTNRIDDESIALPSSNRPPKPSWIRILRKRRPIRPDLAQRAAPTFMTHTRFS